MSEFGYVLWKDLPGQMQEVLVRRGLSQESWDGMNARAQKGFVAKLEKELVGEPSREEAGVVETVGESTRSRPTRPRRKGGFDLNKVLGLFVGRAEAVQEKSGLKGSGKIILALVLMAAGLTVAGLVASSANGKGGGGATPIAETVVIPTVFVEPAPTNTPVVEGVIAPTPTESVQEQEPVPTPTVRKIIRRESPPPSNDVITDVSVAAAPYLGGFQWLLIVGALLIFAFSTGEAINRVKSLGGQRRGIFEYGDALSSLLGIAGVVFLSVDKVGGLSAARPWLVGYAVTLAFLVLTGGVDLTPLWSFLLGASAGFFLTGSAGLFGAIPGIGGMPGGVYNLGDCIQIINNTKTVPLAMVFHLAMVTSVVGLVLDVLHESGNPLTLVVGVVWPAVYWGLGLISPESNLGGLSKPVPALLVAGIFHLIASMVISGVASNGNTDPRAQRRPQVNRFLAGVARMDYLLLGVSATLWTAVAF